MIVPDLNLVLYATNSASPWHVEARGWWNSTLRAGTPVGLTWQVILGFVRLTTNAAVFRSPLPPTDSLAVVEAWLDNTNVTIIQPTGRHLAILRELLSAAGRGGNLVSDAHLAALAIEHGAQLHSADNDFAQFAGLDWYNPLARREDH